MYIRETKQSNSREILYKVELRSGRVDGVHRMNAERRAGRAKLPANDTADAAGVMGGERCSPKA
jgi:hypothetical protein